MGMFVNYQTLDNYTPNNLVCSFPVGKSYTKLAPVQASKPYEEYNAKGELIGYFWRYGDTLNLEFNIDGEITLESDAIVYVDCNDGPTITTEGFLCQRAYNLTDFRSWTCTKIIEGNYIWEEDSEFIYDENAGEKVYVSAEDFLSDKQIEIQLYNFRLEPIFRKVFEGSTKVIFPITTEISEIMKRGIYYCSLTVFNSEMKQSIFDNRDCTLVVK